MRTVRIVSKPIAPPWNDASKNLARTLLTFSNGFAYRFFGTPDSRLLERANVTCDVATSSPGSFEPSVVDNLKVFRRLLARERGIDVYHFFFTPNRRTSTALRWLFTVRPGTTIQTVCSCPRDPADGHKLLFASRNVTVSDATAAALKDGGVHNAVRIYPGIVPPVVEDDRVARLRAKLQLPADGRCVLFSGDYEYSKAHPVILAALPGILGRHRDVDFVFACRHKTPAARAIETSVRAGVQALGLASRVHFFDQVDEFPALLRLASIVVFPVQSLYHKMDLPLSLLEAMALERPIIVSDLGALRELLPEPAGLMVTPGDADALERAVGRLLESDDLRLEMGQIGRRLIGSRFSAQRMVEEYEELYGSLVS